MFFEEYHGEFIKETIVKPKSESEEEELINKINDADEDGYIAVSVKRDFLNGELTYHIVKKKEICGLLPPSSIEKQWEQSR